MSSDSLENARILSSCNITTNPLICPPQSKQYYFNTSSMSNPSILWTLTGSNFSLTSGQGTHYATFSYLSGFTSGQIHARAIDGIDTCTSTINIAKDLPCKCQGNDLNCGDTYSGSWSSYGYHSYSGQSFQLCAYNGQTITIHCYAAAVPNRFNIWSSSGGGLVVSSNWMGDADYAGPWGQSIHTNNTKDITFTKSQDQYWINVETSVNTQSDYWDATVLCP